MKRADRAKGLAAAAALAAGVAAAPADERLLCGFEDERDLAQWEIGAGRPELTAEWRSEGARSLAVAFDPEAPYHGAYLNWRKVVRDWSACDALALDVRNPGPDPVAAYVLVADEAWAARGRSYWNRHNAERVFAPGAHAWVIPVRGLYRGEAGSRNNDIKSDVDPARIVRVDFGFGARGTEGRVLVDGLRLVKSSRPPGVRAFDFGPPSQAVMPGWTPVSHETRYSAAAGFGWGPAGGTPWNGAARDTTFGPLLLRDFCEAGGYRFRVDVPAGRYRVLVFFENSGYWGGEQAQHRERRIFANEREAWRETRPDGPAHALYRFEDVEPVGVDLWDAYLRDELARPAEFSADAAGDGLTLRFEADRVWGSKVAAVALHRDDDGEARAWADAQVASLAGEFRQQAVRLDPSPAASAPPPAWAGAGLVAWEASPDADFGPHTTPPAGAPGPADLALASFALQGESEAALLLVRPARDLGEADLALEPPAGPAPLEAEARIVHYGLSRGFGTIACRVVPHTLRLRPSVRMPAGVARGFLLKARTRPDQPPGVYAGAFALRAKADGRLLLRVPWRVEVRGVRIARDTPFRMGFFGLEPPELVPAQRRGPLLDATLDLLRDYGLNAVSGGPDLRLLGWRDGQPQVDCGELDAFFRTLRRHGFDGPLNGYGGARFAGLHDGYRQGAAGERVERESGLPYDEAVRRAWAAVDRHARAAGWPTILYAMCDETRVRDVAEAELAFMRIMAGATAAHPATVRASGSYSVGFDRRPQDPADPLYWHQRFFETLDVSSLNDHDDAVLAEARRLGKQVHVYNQGTSRYSFGLYQWNEFRHGVAARWQWHLNVLHGYQFFDLDGREPDTAMICYGRTELYPTLDLERCREGAEDFHLYHTVWAAAAERLRAAPGDAAAREAQALLDRATAGIAVNQRRPPPGYDPAALKRALAGAVERLPAAR